MSHRSPPENWAIVERKDIAQEEQAAHTLSAERIITFGSLTLR